MEEKINALVTVCFLCAILLTFTIADFCSEDRLFSEYENRILAAKPELNRETLRNGSYMKDYEAYVTDQFISRDTWITIKTWGDTCLQKRAINGVYLGKDEYLFQQHLEEDIKMHLADDKIELLKTLVERYHAKIMLVPTADNIMSDKLPVNAIYYDQKKFLDQVTAEVGAGNVIDVYEALEEHSREEIYYRTDPHWTTLGAYYGYQAWVSGMRRFAFPYDTDKLVTVSEDFLGTLHSMININRKPESIQIFPETLKRPVSITYDFQTHSQTLYEDKYLETKNQYGYFLDDNHAFIQIETGYKNGKEIVIIKDSYANCFIPLLTPHYEKIYVIDLRYCRGKLYDLIDENTTSLRPDVLVLYNCISFIRDFMYY